MLKPLNNSIFGIFLELEPRKSGLILMPENELTKTILEVKAISQEITDIEVGNKVIIKKYAGTEVGGAESGLIVDYDDVLAILE